MERNICMNVQGVRDRRKRRRVQIAGPSNFPNATLRCEVQAPVPSGVPAEAEILAPNQGPIATGGKMVAIVVHTVDLEVAATVVDVVRHRRQGVEVALAARAVDVEDS
mmetsp:Transcript_11172/g.18232  ORF Transcript_11172/g.18232 Transcript_11172/m.18232 type:complete len:108 (-) Transcript_11172:458-781(-)